MQHRDYSCYGLRLRSDLELPELLPANTHTGDTSDVRVELGPVPVTGLAAGRQIGPFLWCSRDALWLQVHRVGRYLIRHGNHILIDPEPAASEDSLRLFLLGSAMGALLMQRGLLVLHGNAIRVGDGCLVCVGESGAGKSTLAAGLLRRGHTILADDVVPVDAQGLALPGFPRIKLWQDTARELGIETADLRRIHPELEKFHYPLFQAFVDRPLPVRRVYILNTHPEPVITVEHLQGKHRFQPLRHHSYRKRFLEGMASPQEHLRLVANLAGRCQVALVKRPRSGFALDPLIDRLLADCAAPP
jgi:hypothetical protein